MNINYLFLILAFLILLLFINKFFNKNIKDIIDLYKTKHYINNFEQYVIILDYFMNKAYPIIYNDRILVYSLEGMKIPDKEFIIVAKDYVNLVLNLLGSNLKKELIIFFGNEETLLFNISEYFNNRLENDQIRKSSMDNIINSDN